MDTERSSGCAKVRTGPVFRPPSEGRARRDLVCRPKRAECLGFGDGATGRTRKLAEVGRLLELRLIASGIARLILLTGISRPTGNSGMTLAHWIETHYSAGAGGRG